MDKITENKFRKQIEKVRLADPDRADKLEVALEKQKASDEILGARIAITALCLFICLIIAWVIR